MVTSNAMNEKPLGADQPEQIIGLNSLDGGNTVSLGRNSMNFTTIEREYGVLPRKTFHQKLKNNFVSRFSCSLPCWLLFLQSVFPIISWLPKYKRSYILPDIISGFTIAVLHIPQGMAYGVLASVKAENGLYLSIFPVVIYLIFGTSHHVSIGTFSVISLMVSNAVFKAHAHESKFDLVMKNHTESNIYEHLPSNLEIVVTLALAVGLFQLVMGIAHLGSFTVLLSDQLVSGFCMGAAFHVAAALIPEVFGITVKRHVGALKLVYACIDIFRTIAESNIATIITTAIAIFVLACVKEQINDRFKTKMKIPVPIDLVVVIIGTAVSYAVDLNGKYNVRIVGYIPTGLPAPLPPRTDLIMLLLKDALAIAIVIYVTTLSMAKLFAKKHRYKIEPNQELIALGCANIFSSFFSCFPCSGALARSSVQERSGGKTQVTSLVSVCFMLLVTLFLSPLFHTLPRCILSAVILVALKGLFLQSREFLKAWKVSKIDAMIWLVTMLSTVLLDVTYGLLVGLVFAVCTVIFRTAFPSSSVLGVIHGTNIYLDVCRFHEAKEIEGMKIFQFKSALNFINRVHFKNTLLRHVPISEDEQASTFPAGKVHHIIIDCSSFSYIDAAGLEMLEEIVKQYAEVGIPVFLAGCSTSLWDMLKKKNVFGNVSSPPIFPTIHDAIQFCNELQ